MSEDNYNGISIFAKNNKEEYPYISISGPSCYRRHKARVLLIHNQGLISPYLRMEIHQMPLLHLTSGESIGRS